jgi:hypothetical protein
MDILLSAKKLPVCNICQGPADLENEGGIQGYIGIISFTLCVWCHAGMTDMVEATCENCQQENVSHENVRVFK